MRSITQRSKPLLALAALFALGVPAAAGSYAMCGTLVPGVECALLFEDTAGDRWLLADYGGFQLGDFVRVTGTADPGCISFCFVGCIGNNTIGPCSDPIDAYCTCPLGACGNADASAGCANSTGSGALLSGQGTTSVSADDLFLTVAQLPPNQNAIFFMGSAPTNQPFGDGFRCVAPGATGVFRFAVQNSGSAGVITRGPIVGYTHANFQPSGQIQPGDTWYLQSWYRDPGGPCGSNFNVSNAASATFGA